MNPILRKLPLLAAAAVIASVPVWARTWTDKDGKKIEASLVDSTDKDVTIQMEDSGKIVTLPLTRLCKEDLEFLGKSVPEETAPVKPVVPAPKKEMPPQPPAGKDTSKEPVNFDAPWPQSVRFDEDPQIQTVSEDKEKNRFVYESAHYRFVCNVRLSITVVKGFAVMFESTYQYCRALPLAITGGQLTDGKFQILLFETKEEYIEAGGPPTSAGVFMGGRGIVMVPLTSLGVRKVGSGYMVDHSKENGTLIHELTHQLTPEPYYSKGCLGWFTEGLAEYTNATPYRAGLFKVKSNFDDIVAYATAYGKEDTHGRALGDKIKAPALQDFFMMSYSQFAGSRANFNYGFGLLLTTYFLHLDGNGDAARTKKFLQALRDGKKGQAAVDVLLDGRSYKQMEEDISKAWKKKRVDIEFSAPSGRSAADEDEDEGE